MKKLRPTGRASDAQGGIAYGGCETSTTGGFSVQLIQIPAMDSSGPT